MSRQKPDPFLVKLVFQISSLIPNTWKLTTRSAGSEYHLLIFGPRERIFRRRLAAIIITETSSTLNLHFYSGITNTQKSIINDALGKVDVIIS